MWMVVCVKRILLILLTIWIIGSALGYGISCLIQDIKEREHLEHQANVTRLNNDVTLYNIALPVLVEAKAERIQELWGDWRYPLTRNDKLMGSWAWLEAQQDVNKFNEVIDILKEIDDD